MFTYTKSKTALLTIRQEVPKGTKTMIREHPNKAMGASLLEGQLSPYFNSPTSQIKTKTPAMNSLPSRQCHPQISLCFSSFSSKSLSTSPNPLRRPSQNSSFQTLWGIFGRYVLLCRSKLNKPKCFITGVFLVVFDCWALNIPQIFDSPYSRQCSEEKQQTLKQCGFRIHM